MTIGNVAAIMQKNISRMLAYSSIAHAGYILIGLAVAPYSSLGLQGSLYQIFNHAVMKGAAFIAIAGIVTTLAVTHIDKLKGLGRRMPITALGISDFIICTCRCSTTSGFWSKLMLFGSALMQVLHYGGLHGLQLQVFLTVHYHLLTMVGLQERCTLKEKQKREFQNQNQLLQ